MNQNLNYEVVFEYGLLWGEFKFPTNNSDIERLFAAPLGAFNTTNSGDIKSGFKEGLRGAFLPSIIRLSMIELFRAPAMNAGIIYDNDFIGSADQAPAPNIANFNYDFDFKKERDIEVKGFSCTW